LGSGDDAPSDYRLDNSSKLALAVAVGCFLCGSVGAALNWTGWFHSDFDALLVVGVYFLILSVASRIRLLLRRRAMNRKRSNKSNADES
jgi:uncharacterized membrane protein